MAKKQPPAAPEHVVAAYHALIATQPQLTIRGAKLPYTAHNGNMFTIVSKEGEIGLRLSKEDREAFMSEHDGGPLMTYGSQLREYVAVPESLLDQTDVLARVLAQSWAYVQTLKPKPTKAKKKS